MNNKSFDDYKDIIKSLTYKFYTNVSSHGGNFEVIEIFNIEYYFDYIYDNFNFKLHKDYDSLKEKESFINFFKTIYKYNFTNNSIKFEGLK